MRENIVDVLVKSTCSEPICIKLFEMPKTSSFQDARRLRSEDVFQPYLLNNPKYSNTNMSDKKVSAFLVALKIYFYI